MNQNRNVRKRKRKEEERKRERDLFLVSCTLGCMADTRDNSAGEVAHFLSFKISSGRCKGFRWIEIERERERAKKRESDSTIGARE